MEMGLTSSGGSLEADGFNEPFLQGNLNSTGSLKVNPQIQRLKSEDLGFVCFDNSRDELVSLLWWHYKTVQCWWIFQDFPEISFKRWIVVH